MKLSTKGRYGLKAMLDLAEQGNDSTVSTASIASRQNLSESYLEQLIRKLRNAGIVNSVRGKAGGYSLARPSDQISVGDILRALEGDLKAVDCDGENGICKNADKCTSKIVWDRINSAIENSVDSVMLSELIEMGRRNNDEN